MDIVFDVFSHFSTPRNDDRNRFVRRNGYGIHRAIHSAQVADLTIGWILDKCFSGYFIRADNVCRAGFDAYPAADTALNLFDSHAQIPVTDGEAFAWCCLGR